MSRIRVPVRAAALCAALLAALSPAVALAAPHRTLGIRPLRVGMHGRDVATLQADLSRLGLRTSVDGQFGPATRRSVRRLQRRDHLRSTGIVSRGFARRLIREVEGGPVARTAHHGLGDRVLRRPMHGGDVRALQRALTAAGYPTGTDGQFGPHTEHNLERWQGANGLPVTGVLTRAEARTLRAAHVSTTTTTDPGAATATIAADGRLVLPAGAPAAVQQIVAAANQIIDTPYAYGGGHASFTDNAYDCSGAVSEALHGAGLLDAPEDSTGLESFGRPGAGAWVTVYADAAHTFLVVAGRAFDTADYGGPDIPSGSGPRWRSSPTGNLADGGNYVVRHPAGL